MTWWGWLLLAVNVGGYLVAWWLMTGLIAWAEKGGYRDVPAGDDVFFGAFLGLFAALVWPVAIAYAVKPKGRPWGLLYTPRDRKMSIQRERIRTLERELGVR